MKHIVVGKSNEDSLFLLIGFYVFSLVLINVVAYLDTTGTEQVSGQISLISKLIILILLACNSSKFISSYSKRFIVFVLFIFVVFLHAIVFSDLKEAVLAESIKFWVMVFPLVLVLVKIKHFDMLLSVLRKISYLIVMIFPMLCFFKNNKYSYSMGLANSLVVPTMVLLYYYFVRRQKRDLLFAIIIIAMIFIWGSRGALLSVISFVAFFYMKNIKQSKYARRIYFAAIAFVCVGFLSPILLELLDDWFQSLGIQSRTIWVLLHNPVYFSGREDIYISIVEGIIDDPFNIRGIAGERMLANGAYAHNFILQLFGEFGIVFGMLSSTIIMLFTMVTLKFERVNSERGLKLILFSASVPRMLISGSIWSEPYFWMWFVMCMEGAKREKCQELC